MPSSLRHPVHGNKDRNRDTPFPARVQAHEREVLAEGDSKLQGGHQELISIGPKSEFLDGQTRATEASDLFRSFVTKIDKKDKFALGCASISKPAGMDTAKVM
ncbi:monocarboxylate transporter 3 [Anopheles sinensis]|uniref:Monocarboxylate transporter 3 n=1 Tax=Anopheles sinensis TaxID=74873 RepID=A0A084WSD1_ANOSI|nr:monocarboxylate transporter 3 [Anopheles sinensis]